MKAILAVLSLALSACAALGPTVVGHIEMGQGGYVTLLGSPCEGKVRALIDSKVREEFRAGWRSADSVFFMLNTGELKRFAGCWKEPPVELTGGVRHVLILFEDGDTLLAPRSRFEGHRETPKPATLRI